VYTGTATNVEVVRSACRTTAWYPICELTQRQVIRRAPVVRAVRCGSPRAPLEKHRADFADRAHLPAGDLKKAP
jgi:hypothetical protein